MKERRMNQSIALLGARLIFGGLFLFAASMKLSGITETAGSIASIGFPAPTFFAWVAAFFEIALGLSFITGALFVEGAVLAAAYVAFLTVAFHGPARWHDSPMEFGLFLNHLAFIAGLIFAAVHGPGSQFVVGRNLSWRLVKRGTRPRTAR
jgi:uncharacterized membrane protein YphA (DoxX/SURF4 family)